MRARRRWILLDDGRRGEAEVSMRRGGTARRRPGWLAGRRALLKLSPWYYQKALAALARREIRRNRHVTVTCILAVHAVHTNHICHLHVGHTAAVPSLYNHLMHMLDTSMLDLTIHANRMHHIAIACAPSSSVPASRPCHGKHAGYPSLIVFASSVFL